MRGGCDEIEHSTLKCVCWIIFGVSRDVEKVLIIDIRVLWDVFHSNPHENIALSEKATVKLNRTI